jgi:uncharacterized membrane protein (UPF0182 family)
LSQTKTHSTEIQDPKLRFGKVVDNYLLINKCYDKGEEIGEKVRV